MTAMEEFIARENITRFEAQLRRACEPGQRATIEGLLEAEREHLAMIRKAGEGSRK